MLEVLQLGALLKRCLINQKPPARKTRNPQLAHPPPAIVTDHHPPPPPPQTRSCHHHARKQASLQRSLAVPCSKLAVVVFKLAIVPAKSFVTVLKHEVVSAVLPGSFLFAPSLCLNSRRRLRKGGTQNSAPSNNDASEAADGGEDMMLLSFTLPKFSVTVFLMKMTWSCPVMRNFINPRSRQVYRIVSSNTTMKWVSIPRGLKD
ncbi:hypothetical protein PIB30_101764 [Stylosanthes scabra]|uniref:Uncharacterized protein n=1 Tax=Stylosanthes scabra TaxID=79078 RepID=A0ABU6SXU9_9FABA|nr:hypothetical protein [Stylosanthes scabra]